MNNPYINIHCHSEGAEKGVIKVKSYLMGRDTPISDGPYSVGVHPWVANSADQGLLDQFPWDDKNFVAIGEFGLDFSAKNLDKPKQMWWLEEQLSLAETHNKPIIIHCVKAYNELLSEVKHYDIAIKIAHGFIGSEQLAAQLVEAGFYLSFGVTSFQSYRTIEALKTIPLERIFLETDDRVDHTIEDIYKKAAEALEISDIEIVKQQIHENYKRCKIG